MSVVLFVVGAIAVIVGVAMVGYGIPINEFSFGNTLIVAGTTTAVGGVIVIAIGVAVAQLQRIAETLGTRAPARSNRPLDMFEAPTGSRTVAAQGRRPSEVGTREPQPLTGAPASDEMPVEDRAATAPTLRNPDTAVATVAEQDSGEYEEVSLSPQHAFSAPTRPAPPLSANGSGMAVKLPEPAFDTPWRSSPPPVAQTQTSYFDSMWPAESAPARRPVEAKPEPVAEKPETQAGKTKSIAILKSGVVDGMGYTLYVDGSIEAELPQGTLRFASIDELRSHLTK